MADRASPASPQLVMGFFGLLSGGILVIQGITGSTLRSVVAGHPDRAGAAPAPAASGTAATTGGAAATSPAPAGSGAIPGTNIPQAASGTLSKAALQRLWVQAGGPPATADLAAAIAMAESGGQISNAGDVGIGGSGATSFGLWQIHTPAHPQYNAGKLASDPLYNARAAVQVSNGGRTFTPWTTYLTGAYRKFL